MITVKENTTLIGVSELRTRMDEVLLLSRKQRVVIERRHKPLAVLIDAGQYAKMEERLDVLEDFALAYLAKDRERKSHATDYVSIEEALALVKA